MFFSTQTTLLVWSISAMPLWWENFLKHWLISKDPLSDREHCAGARQNKLNQRKRSIAQPRMIYIPLAALLSREVCLTQTQIVADISLQVLSGKQPWSEIKEDVAVVLRLAKGYKPGRPKSRALNDSHWNFIQTCWSPVEQRPSTEAIIFAIQMFLSHCPESLPLCDSIKSWPSQVELGLNSSNYVAQVTDDDDGQTR